MMQPDLWYSLPVLKGRLVRLEPLSLEHAGGYLAAAGTGAQAVSLFRWFDAPAGAPNPPATVPDAVRQIAAMLAGRARGEQLPYAVMDVASGRLAGVTGFRAVDPAARSIGIGRQWLGSRWRQSGHDLESALLMLTYAFDALGAVRLWWQLDAADSRSRAELAGFGATEEGVLRKHRPAPQGGWHDTAQYALTDDDWPRVRAILTGRQPG